MSYPSRQQAARQGAWGYLVGRKNLPNIPYRDMADSGMGLLVQPDDPAYLDVLREAFSFGVSPGLWVPDRDGEGPGAYASRVIDATKAIASVGLGPWKVVVNPEHNAIGTQDWSRKPGEEPHWWKWMDNLAGILKTTFPSRLFSTSIPAMQDYVNWPAVFRLGDASLQLYGGSSGEQRFDPVDSFERLRRNSYMDPADVDPRRVSFDVGCRHTDWYLEGAVPRLAQAGLRGISLWTLDEDVTQQGSSFVKYAPLVRNGALALKAA
jgi:hypothetical protein